MGTANKGSSEAIQGDSDDALAPPTQVNEYDRGHDGQGEGAG